MTFEENVAEIRRMWGLAVSGDQFYIKTGQPETGQVPPKLGFAFHAERDRFVQEALDAIVAEHDDYKAQRDALQEERDHYRVRVGEEVEAGLREMGILRDERDALQERAGKWSLFEAWYAESRWMGGPQWDALVAALPPQETDPE